MNNEWYTPPHIIKLAREVMHKIDLDPASCLVANQIVQATMYYDRYDDGLGHDWNGKVWLNPPYSRGLIERFVNKLLLEVYHGKTTEAICLTNNCTETDWFQKILRKSNAVCFLRGRLKFLSLSDLSEHRVTGTPRCGQVLFYFGANRDLFVSVFRHSGKCF